MAANCAACVMPAASSRRYRRRQQRAGMADRDRGAATGRQMQRRPNIGAHRHHTPCTRASPPSRRCRVARLRRNTGYLVRTLGIHVVLRMLWAGYIRRKSGRRDRDSPENGQLTVRNSPDALVMHCADERRTSKNCSVDSSRKEKRSEEPPSDRFDRGGVCQIRCRCSPWKKDPDAGHHALFGDSCQDGNSLTSQRERS
jgi:hypothetical protein